MNNKTKGKGIIFLVLLLSLFITSKTTCYAATAKTYDISKQNIVISKSGDYIITGSTDKYKIQVKKGVTANITFKEVTINNSYRPDNSNEIDLVDIKSGAKVNLTLIGENKLTNDYHYTAIHVPNGTVLTITAKSTGSLTAVAGGTAIGGSVSDLKGETGTIIINGGTIYAKGGWSSCGIGGGASERFSFEASPRCYLGGGDITINGGNVTAIGGSAGGLSDAGAAGIGGASLTRQGKITINGGVINASSIEAGIGGESSFGKGNIITITGGVITANGDNYASGIGNSLNPVGTIVNISGGTIYAKGDYGDNTLYEAYVSDRDQFLDSLKAYDIAAEKTVITGGNILAYTFYNKPVDYQGKEVGQMLFNCPKGKITGILFTKQKYGAKDVISDGYLSVFLPFSYQGIKVMSGTKVIYNDPYLSTGSHLKAVENIDETKNLKVDLSKGDLELVDGGCIFNNKVYRTDNIIVTGSVTDHKIIVHTNDYSRQKLILQNLKVDYQEDGAKDFLVLDNDITLDIILEGENTFKLGDNTRGIFVGNDANLCFLGDGDTDLLHFVIGEKSKAIYTNIGNVIVYGGCLDFDLGTDSSAVNTGNYGTFTLCGGKFEAHGGGNSAITGLYRMKVMVYGGILSADMIGSIETGNEEVVNQNHFVMTGGSVDVSGRMIFGDYKIYGGLLKSRILGSGTGCVFTMYGGELEIGAYINHIQGEAVLDVNKENILGGTILQRNDVPEEELKKLMIYTG